MKNVINFNNLAREDHARHSVAINNVFKVMMIIRVFCISEKLSNMLLFYFVFTFSMQWKDNDAEN